MSMSSPAGTLRVPSSVPPRFDRAESPVPCRYPVHHRPRTGDHVAVPGRWSPPPRIRCRSKYISLIDLHVIMLGVTGAPVPANVPLYPSPTRRSCRRTNVDADEIVFRRHAAPTSRNRVGPVAIFVTRTCQPTLFLPPDARDTSAVAEKSKPSTEIQRRSASPCAIDRPGRFIQNVDAGDEQKRSLPDAMMRTMRITKTNRRSALAVVGVRSRISATPADGSACCTERVRSMREESAGICAPLHATSLNHAGVTHVIGPTWRKRISVPYRLVKADPQ